MLERRQTFSKVERADEIGRVARLRLAAHEYPRCLRCLDTLPMTTTGKIIRRALRDLAEAEARAAPEAEHG